MDSCLRFQQCHRSKGKAGRGGTHSECSKAFQATACGLGDIKHQGVLYTFGATMKKGKKKHIMERLDMTSG